MKKLIPIAKVLVSLGLIVFLFKIVDLENLKETLMGIDPVYLVLAVIVMFSIVILASVRWRLCLAAQGIDISVGSSINYSLIGFFFNNFAPSTVGGDVAKGFIVGRSSKKKMGTVISILMDRLVGLLATGILALVALVISFNLPLDKRIRLVILLFVFIVTILFFLILHKGISHKLVYFLSRRRLKNIADKILSISDSFSIYRSYPRFIKKTLALSLTLQFTNIVASYIIALGLGVNLSFLYFLVFIPLIMAIMAIPVSLNGLGLREGAYVVFFNLAGISKEGALAISIAYYIGILFLSLLGGILLLRSGFKKERL